jgi:sterol 24-C-methyltransferase
MEAKDVLLLGAVAAALYAVLPLGTLGMPVATLLLLLLGPSLSVGVKQTVTFLSSMSKSKKQTAGRIDGYTKQFGEEKSTGDRNEDYASLVNDYYDLATEFYEWGWGTSFHFADRRKGESFQQSILRHEYYLAGRLGVNKGSLLLDCGCGIGGPARNMAKFSEANIKAITINQFQVDRGNAICKREGLDDKVQLIQGDFMKLPFPDNHFDGVYAIESTCHAPDRSKVYSEILRVLKPGGIFACYEWCLTDDYDENNEHHRKIKLDIMLGDGLPDLVHTSVCTAALGEAGFELIETRDMAKGGAGEGGEPWHMPLMPSWNPTKWPRFQFNPVMYRLMPIILRFFEAVRLVPAGTVDTQVMLQAGGVGCAQGGHTGSFTPMWLMVGRKPR